MVGEGKNGRKGTLHTARVEQPVCSCSTKEPKEFSRWNADIEIRPWLLGAVQKFGTLFSVVCGLSSAKIVTIP